MQVIRPVGREAAAKKYGILSAMMDHALAGDQHRQRLVLRLMSLITTRYNWQRNELTMGQKEIARLWCVDERTVKRDMARLRALGWLLVKAQGTQGRVSVLGLDIERVMLDTRQQWPNIGPDFVERAGGPAVQAPVDDKVVPFRRAQSAAAGALWGRARQTLSDEDPALFEAWLACVADCGVQEGRLQLIAPTRFHADYLRTHLQRRIEVAVSRADPSIRDVQIRSVEG